jgi:hypothetical protein
MRRRAGAGTTRDFRIPEMASPLSMRNLSSELKAIDMTQPKAVMSEAADVGKSAAERAGDVTGVIGDQAKQVASETRAQARNLLDEGMDQVRGQARDGQRKLADGLRTVADQLRQMSDRTEDSGMASDLVRQATDRTEQVASWLEAREPGDLLDEVRRFARRRPGMFLAGAAVAGVLAGRLTRNMVASTQNGADGGPDRQRVESDRPGVEAGWRSERPAAMADRRATDSPVANYPPPGTPDYAPEGAAFPPVTPTGPGSPQGPMPGAVVPPAGPVVPPAGPSVMPGPGPVR